MEGYKMTEKIYKVQTPNGIVKVAGPEGATDSEIIAQAQRLYNPSAKTDENKEVNPYEANLREALAFIPESKKVMGGMIAGLGGETIKNVGALTELVSPKYGKPITQYGEAMTNVASEANPISSTIGQIGSYVIPTNMAAKVASKIAPAAQTLLPNLLRSGAVGGTVALGTTPGSVEERMPAVAINTAVGGAIPVAGKALEEVGKKILPKIAESPTAEFLSNKATELFTKAKDSGVVLNTKDFANTMKTIGKEGIGKIVKAVTMQGSFGFMGQAAPDKQPSWKIDCYSERNIGTSKQPIEYKGKSYYYQGTVYYPQHEEGDKNAFSKLK
jgi:hypothetical protein